MTTDLRLPPLLQRCHDMGIHCREVDGKHIALDDVYRSHSDHVLFTFGGRGDRGPRVRCASLPFGPMHKLVSREKWIGLNNDKELDEHLVLIRDSLDAYMDRCRTMDQAWAARDEITTICPSLDVSVLMAPDDQSAPMEFSLRMTPAQAKRFALPLARLQKRASLFTPGVGPRIYIASRVRHAAKWRALQALGVDVISTWIHEDGEGQSTSKANLWIRCVEEAAGADALIFYVEEGDPLMGAMVEGGAALASMVPVYVVKPEAMYVGSWVNHPSAAIYTSIDAALTRIYHAHGAECPIAILSNEAKV